MRIGLLLLPLILVLALACSEDENTAPQANSIVGEWNLIEFKTDGIAYPPDSLDYGPKIIKFFTDNRGLLYMWDNGKLDEVLSFNWDIAAGLLVITVEGDDDPVSFSYTVTQTRLSFTDEEDTEWIFTRVQ